MPPDEDTEQDTEEGQLALLPELARARATVAKQAAAARAREAAPVETAPERPVARVLVDVPLAHLDRPFDYLVPAKMHDQVVPGSRVKVRFAGQDVDGFVLERVDRSEHEGRLMPLRRAVSPEPVLSPAVARLSELVADRYAGTRSDVLRLAVPSRHATTEKQPSPPVQVASPDLGAAESAWAAYDGGTAFLRRLAEGPARGPCGRRCPGTPGRTCWRTPPPRRTPPGAGCCSACPTTRTSPGWTPR